ncbi:MAG: ClcB-like voltage-gated chloride channel protein [Verrucomicrobia bacterium]|nr:ClcB-like voltage-gated chloride channel protein [Verrucomicrobiota bacterium]
MIGWVRTPQLLTERLRRMLQRHWRRLLQLRERLRFSEEAFHLIVAGLVGVVGGTVDLLVYALHSALEALVLFDTRNVLSAVRDLPWWWCLLLPAAGGLAAGLILHFGLRLVRMPGSTNLLEVVVAGDGRLRFRPGLLQSLSSMFSISTGGSIGREGPIAQLSATLVSKMGQWFHWQPYRLRLLVACGAAAGIAAAYKAPVAGAVFAAQIVLGNFSMNLFAPLVVSAVVAAMVSRRILGVEAWYQMPAVVAGQSMGQLPWFLVLGLMAGALGAVFMKSIRYAELLFNRIKQPLYLRMALGGLAVGGMAILVPEVWGNGYRAANRILDGQYAWNWLALLLFAKLFATAITVGSGAVGGVFTPTLFLGAALGGLLGSVLNELGYAEGQPAAAFALVGMGSVLSATTHSPLLAMILVFEISLNYNLMPPLMVGCAVATIVSRRFHRDSVYTEPLRRRGLELDRENPRLGAATLQTVGDLMREPVVPVNLRARFREVADRFLTNANNFLPVVDDAGRLVGMITLQDLKHHLGAGPELDSVIAFDVMRPPPPCLTPNQSLVDAFPVLLASEHRNVPVISSPHENRLVGAVVRSEALGLLSEAIASREATRS